MSFDRLARHYRWMEWVLAGGKLQRCRTACLSSIRPPRRALLFGEGNGRFLSQLLQHHPDVEVTCIDASASMLAAARKRISRENASAAAKIEWVQLDVFSWRPPPERYDLIVTHFFLDCFPGEELDQVINILAQSAQPDAQWLLADFREPPSGMAQRRARIILRSMYLFFRFATRISARQLVPPEEALKRSGFQLQKRVISEWGLLHSDLWIRDFRSLHL